MITTTLTDQQVKDLAHFFAAIGPLPAADIERMIRQDHGLDAAAYTQRIGGGRYVKCLRIEEEHVSLERVTAPTELPLYVLGG